jgi:hypothetical protein
MINEAEIRRHYELLRPSLNERGHRLFPATRVRVPVMVGRYGGTVAVYRPKGIAKARGRPGLPVVPCSGAEGYRPSPAMDQRVRRSGVGAKN